MKKVKIKRSSNLNVIIKHITTNKFLKDNRKKWGPTFVDNSNDATVYKNGKRKIAWINNYVNNFNASDFKIVEVDITAK